jgi:hypothetical protein
MQMSIAPLEAQKRAQNLGVAETAAVVFAATYEGGLEIPENNNVCTTKAREDTENAHSVTCTHGSGKYVQSVTRAFRLAVPDQGLDSDNGGSVVREFANATPNRYSGHSCPTHDEWGTNGYNDTNYEAHNGACIPLPVWTQSAYILSNPDAWLYDVNNYNGWGNHLDY